MKKIILINKNEIGDLRIAFLENNKLISIETESEESKFQKGNIFKGFITKIEESLDALFIDYGSNKDGFLIFKEISKDYLNTLKIYEMLEKKKQKTIIGKMIIVQIEKEEYNEKGASLTTYLNVSGCYLILIPNKINLKGISKKIKNKKKFKLKELITKITAINDFGIIIRTFGYGKKIIDLEIEILFLLSQLKFVKILYNNTPLIIYEHSNLITRILKEHLKTHTEKIIIDNIDIFNYIYKNLSIINKKLISKIEFNTKNKNIFEIYSIENQIELLFNREIFLPSGGSITIDIEEAMTFIDINSSKSNKCDDLEETSLQTNLEAINEITRQLKLRDIGGLIIIDFIDIDYNDFELVEKKFKKFLSLDKAKINIGKISKFGILELSREKIKSNLTNNIFSICNKCYGTGKQTNIENKSTNIISSIQKEITKKNITQINIEVSNKLSNYLNNFKKNEIIKLEKIYRKKIIIIANEFLDINEYKIYLLKYKNKIKKI